MKQLGGGISCANRGTARGRKARTGARHGGSATGMRGGLTSPARGVAAASTDTETGVGEWRRRFGSCSPLNSVGGGAKPAPDAVTAAHKTDTACQQHHLRGGEGTWAQHAAGAPVALEGALALMKSSTNSELLSRSNKCTPISGMVVSSQVGMDSSVVMSNARFCATAAEGGTQHHTSRHTVRRGRRGSGAHITHARAQEEQQNWRQRER